MSLKSAARIPIATYRLQLHGGFTFSDLRRLLPYLERAGVTDCYLSPILLSAPGSQHGYDVNDYRKIDPELGGRAEFDRLSDEAAGRGMGLLVDFVPNHMGINGPFNVWWRQVLEGGRHSPYARFFDISWNDNRFSDRPRVLLPVLEDHFGRVLEEGKFQVRYEAGQFELAYGEMRLPLSPNTYGRLLRFASQGDASPAPAVPGHPPAESGGTARELAVLADQFSGLPHPEAAREPERARERTKRIGELKQRLDALCRADPEVLRRIQACLIRVNGRPGDASSFDLLEDLLEGQHYRLARWQAGAQGTNYRRFFAIDSLIGVRMEIPEVFRESHLLMANLIREGRVTGLRIDHIDGLWDPEEYLDRLQELSKGLYVVVEKILEGKESLPPSWPVHGTTGYDFIPQLALLFVDRRAEARFNAIYAGFTGATETYENVVYSKKRLIIESLFAGIVARLAQSLADLLKQDRTWRDLTAHEIALAVREIMATMGVYRTYRRCGSEMRPEDRLEVRAACSRAILRNPRLHPEPFEFLRDLLTGAWKASRPEEEREFENWVLTFQQYTGAVTAKAVEDTAYYTYNRLIALNEVGGDPASFGGRVEEFHAGNRRRLESTPHGLLATSTHDTKLGEDVRARLYALSEIPGAWESWIREWRDLNRRHKTYIDGRLAPDANEEYRFYQILLGAWPLDGRIDETFRERLRQHVRKAVSEAKENTTWHHPNEAWLAAGDRFINALLDEAPPAEFLESFRPKAERLARLGMVNSLSQVVLKITSPGVPDFYQGNEIWDFSLVDPDNRRPVDYELRQSLLGGPVTDWRGLLRDWRSGAIKLRVTERLLQFRKSHAELFRSGAYLPLAPRGLGAENVVAFARTGPEGSVLVIVPRLTSLLGCPPLGLVWEDTRIDLETAGVAGPFEDVLTGRPLAPGPELALADALTELPFLVAAARTPGGKGT